MELGFGGFHQILLLQKVIICVHIHDIYPNQLVLCYNGIVKWWGFFVFMICLKFISWHSLLHNLMISLDSHLTGSQGRVRWKELYAGIYFLLLIEKSCFLCLSIVSFVRVDWQHWVQSTLETWLTWIGVTDPGKVRSPWPLPLYEVSWQPGGYFCLAPYPLFHAFLQWSLQNKG